MVSKLARATTGPTIMRRDRQHASLRRWGDVLALATVGGGTVALVGAVYVPCDKLLTAPRWLVPGVALVAVAIWYFTGRKRRLSAALGIRHLFAYPPFWVAALGGAALLLASSLFVPFPLRANKCWLSPEIARGWFTPSPPGMAAITLVLAVLLVTWRVAAARGARVDRSDHARDFAASLPAEGAERTLTLRDDFSAQRKWFLVDSAVGDPDLNAFDHHAVATRFAGHLVSAEKPAVALVGRVGSGKTTILGLTVHELLRAGRVGSDVSVVRLSLWPFNTVDAAVRGVLDALTKALARHINVLPLAGLPSRYVEAIEGVDPYVAAVGRLLTAVTTPQAILRAYDDAARAIGVRFVLWIEDLERFSGAHSGTHDGSEQTRLSPLRALLNELAECTSLQVVLSASGPSQKFDFEKFARYVEGVPTVTPQEVYTILRTFRDGCRQLYPSDVDPAARDERDKFLAEESPEHAEMAMALNRGYVSPQRALAVLCSTPRTLKFALRDCYDAWLVLHGEIDFDDLLTISVLGAAEPQVKAVIINNLIDFRFGVDSEKRKKNERVDVESDLEAALAGRNSQTRAAVERALLMLFPNWRVGQSSERDGRPQGISATHTDYWLRYQQRAPIPEQESDQHLLRSVDEWRVAASDSFPRSLAREGGSARITTFVRGSCSDSELARLLKDVVEAETEVSPETWRTEHYARGVAAVRSVLFSRSPQQPQELLDAVLEAIARCWPRYLPVAYSLADLFGERPRQTTPVFERELGLKIISAFSTGLLRSFAGRPDMLVEALKGAAMEVLYHSCTLAGLVRGNEEPSADWPSLRATILDATELNPDVMAPQLTLFVTRTEELRPVEGRFPARFEEAAAARLFDVDRLLVAVSRATETPVTDAAIPHYRALLQKAAKHSKGR